MVVRGDYQRAYTEEMRRTYPVVDQFEEAHGFAIGRGLLQEAAWLACPVKVNPPNWQHGRVIYTALRTYLSTRSNLSPVNCLDIGTAKGFSALCAAQALVDGGAAGGQVTSVDVIDPNAKVLRNSIADCGGTTTLYELLAPFRGLHSGRVTFLWTPGVQWLEGSKERIHFAFVDGKHKQDVVLRELTLLASRQEAEDIVIADDVQIPGVAQAVLEAGKWYATSYLDLTPVSRRYAIMRRVV